MSFIGISLPSLSAIFLAVTFSADTLAQSYIDHLGLPPAKNADIVLYDDNTWEARCFADYDPKESGVRQVATYPLSDPYPCRFKVQFSNDGGRSHIEREFSCTVPGGDERECRTKIEASEYKIPRGYIPIAVIAKKYLTPAQQAQNCRYFDFYAPNITYPEAKVTSNWNSLSFLDYEIDTQKISVSHRFICDFE